MKKDDGKIDLNLSVPIIFSIFARNFHVYVRSVYTREKRDM